MSYLYLRPSDNVLTGRTVTATAGTPDTDYPLAWLTDNRPAFPIRFPAGAWGVSISVATKSIQLVVLANHSLDATVTLGGVSGSILIPTAPPNSVLLNPYKYLTSATAGVTALTLGGTNIGKTIIGEAFAGVPRTMKALKMSDAHGEFFDGGQDLQGEFSNIPMHDGGQEWQPFGGSQTFTTSELAELFAWRQDQLATSLPSVLIMDTAVNSAKVVLIGEPHWKKADHKDLFDVTLMFMEFPRYRW